MKIKCRSCGKEFEENVTAEQVQNYTPYGGDEALERIVSENCGPCWQEIMGGDYDDDETEFDDDYYHESWCDHY